MSEPKVKTLSEVIDGWYDRAMSYFDNARELQACIAEVKEAFGRTIADNADLRAELEKEKKLAIHWKGLHDFISTAYNKLNERNNANFAAKNQLTDELKKVKGE